MRPINCLILEDDPISQELLKIYIKRLPFLHLFATCNNVVDTFSILNNNSIDLIFCDIEMPDISGIEFLKSLNQTPLVILTTGSEEYAVQAFDLGVVDYLKKPIPFDRFLKSINKVVEKVEGFEAILQRDKYLKSIENAVASEDLPHKADELVINIDHIFVKVNGDLMKILFTEILYIEGMKDYIKIHFHDKLLISYLTMKKIEESLPSHDFLRTHKSFIVRQSEIKTIIGTNSLTLTNNAKIPIGSQFRSQVLERIGGSLIKR